MNDSYSQWDGDVWTQVIKGVLRRRQPRGDGLYESWHANGVLAMEYTKVDGQRQGTMSEWHDNGVLAKETPFVADRAHGIVRQWNREGKLLGEYTKSDGRGIQRTWNEDGSLQLEYEQVTESAARGIVWDDLGKGREAYLWNGKSISKARWFMKLERDGVSMAELEQRFGVVSKRAAK